MEATESKGLNDAVREDMDSNSKGFIRFRVVISEEVRCIKASVLVNFFILLIFRILCSWLFDH